MQRCTYRYEQYSYHLVTVAIPAALLNHVLINAPKFQLSFDHHATHIERDMQLACHRIANTTLPSNLRRDHPRMRAFTYANTRVHFRSRDIRSAVPENPMLHANITSLRLIERELLPIEVLHCVNRIFFTFLAPVTLTLTR